MSKHPPDPITDKIDRHEPAVQSPGNHALLAAPTAPVPFPACLRYDALSGFLVFLIALPLCLAISKASGYPPMAGVFTAIIGGIVGALISNAQLAIKGPAAGLIVIALGAITEFGFTEGKDPAADFAAYRMVLAVGVAAAAIQILFAVFRTGVLGEFFPTSAVHGMLAAIGVIIMAKQIPVAIGVGNKGEVLDLLRELPHKFSEANPEIATIGGVSLAIMFLKPLIKTAWVQKIPSPMIVMLVAIPLGMYFDLEHEHTYTFAAHEYNVGEQFLVNVPASVIDAVTTPDFTALKQPVAWKWVLMFALIGSLESILSAKAVDMLDPSKRKTNLDRDMLAVGVGNLAAAMVGGLPMISEIVRSRANVDNGAQTRFANLFHGLFLLLFVALVPWLIHRIPLAALAAMLVYTGFRLAHPREFLNVLKIGPEQFVIFVVTVIAVLATDLLIGIAIGIGVKFAFHIMNGVPLESLFKAFLDIEQRDDHTCIISARKSAVFSNWIPFRRQILNVGLIQRQNVIVDLSGTTLVDHSVMEKLHEMQQDFTREGLTLEIVGLDAHRQLSAHDFSARRLLLSPIRRITMVADAALEETLTTEAARLGATGYTSIPCYGAGRRQLADGPAARNAVVRIEIIVPAAVCENFLTYLRREILPRHAVTACVETVDAVSTNQFVGSGGGVVP